MALDRLGHEALLADALQQHLARHLALAEAGDLDALREIGGGVLDGVVHVMRRHLHRQPDRLSASSSTVYACGHYKQRGSRSERRTIGANDIVRVMDVWTITLMLGVAALWLWLAAPSSCS